MAIIAFSRGFSLIPLSFATFCLCFLLVSDALHLPSPYQLKTFIRAPFVCSLFGCTHNGYRSNSPSPLSFARTLLIRASFSSLYIVRLCAQWIPPREDSQQVRCHPLHFVSFDFAWLIRSLSGCTHNGCRARRFSPPICGVPSSRSSLPTLSSRSASRRLTRFRRSASRPEPMSTRLPAPSVSVRVFVERKNPSACCSVQQGKATVKITVHLLYLNTVGGSGLFINTFPVH